MGRGYFGIGVYHPKHEVNLGGLWRHASLYGASFVFTIGRRFKKEASDTTKTWKHIPMYHYLTFTEFENSQPYDCPILAIEQPVDGFMPSMLPTFTHPERCIYLLGAEDHGLPIVILKKVHHILTIPTPQPFSMNVSHAGTIVMYDRFLKRR